MPTKKNPSLKNPSMYEDLRDDGASKEKAARISTTARTEGPIGLVTGGQADGQARTTTGQLAAGPAPRSWD
ncbi:hypothetical protein [Aeromicrobium sp. UC242_57]|uniref:DUF7218 family protein n=1 Tax=Aeromicrobium sp. UC242_57 TaxID=3374624 RepID=UPI003798ABB4